MIFPDKIVLIPLEDFRAERSHNGPYMLQALRKEASGTIITCKTYFVKHGPGLNPGPHAHEATIYH